MVQKKELGLETCWNVLLLKYNNSLYKNYSIQIMLIMGEFAAVSGVTMKTIVLT